LHHTKEGERSTGECVRDERSSCH